MSWHPVKDEQAMAWELRGAWATGRVVSVRLDEDLHPVVPRVRGRVVYVSVTGAFALLLPAGETEPWHVPCAAILAVRRPHFTEPIDQPEEPAEVFPGQLPLPLERR